MQNQEPDWSKMRTARDDLRPQDEMKQLIRDKAAEFETPLEQGYQKEIGNIWQNVREYYRSEPKAAAAAIAAAGERTANRTTENTLDIMA